MREDLEILYRTVQLSTQQADRAVNQLTNQVDHLATNQVAERDARLSMREDLEILYQTIQLSTQQTDRAINQLTERVDHLTTEFHELLGIVMQSIQNAEEDRVAIVEMQTEVRGLQVENRQILDYLFERQRGNGSNG